MDALLASIVTGVFVLFITAISFIPAIKRGQGGGELYAYLKKEITSLTVKNADLTRERAEMLSSIEGLTKRVSDLEQMGNKKDAEIVALRLQVQALFAIISGPKGGQPQAAQAVWTAQDAHTSPNKKILIVVSSPRDGTPQLNTDVETRKIQDALRRSGYDVFSVMAATAGDITQALLDHKPDILHFAGHGENGKIVMEDAGRKALPVSLDALARLLKTQRVDGVVLNACDSAANFGVLLTACNWVVAMQDEISDPSALAFSAAFYAAIAAGQSPRSAYDIGAANVGMGNLSQMEVPVFVESK